MNKNKQNVFNLIQEVTRKDGSKYFDLSNMVGNGRAEQASELGLIEQVRIIKLNIMKTKNVLALEEFINANYSILDEDFSEWIEWKRTPEMEEVMKKILDENQIG